MSAALLIAAAVAGAPALLADDRLAVGPGWQRVLLPAQRLPATHYDAEFIDGRRALRIDADRSYGNLVAVLEPGAPAPRVLRWSWRVAQVPGTIDLRTKAGDDSPARVCLSFDWPDARVPFIERQLLRLARARSAQALPGATLCWAWGNREAPGDAITSPYTRRVRTIVLRNATHAGSAWFDEMRDVRADLRRAFGDELPPGAPLPAAVALIVAGDADNTASRSTAWIVSLVLE
jgi:hypothetical protein